MMNAALCTVAELSPAADSSQGNMNGRAIPTPPIRAFMINDRTKAGVRLLASV